MTKSRNKKVPQTSSLATEMSRLNYKIRDAYNSILTIHQKVVMQLFRNMSQPQGQIYALVESIDEIKNKSEELNKLIIERNAYAKANFPHDELETFEQERSEYKNYALVVDYLSDPNKTPAIHNTFQKIQELKNQTEQQLLKLEEKIKQLNPLSQSDSSKEISLIEIESRELNINQALTYALILSIELPDDLKDNPIIHDYLQSQFLSIENKKIGLKPLIEAQKYLSALREQNFFPENGVKANIDLKNDIITLEPIDNDSNNQFLIQAFNETFGTIAKVAHAAKPAAASSSLAGGAAGAATVTTISADIKISDPPKLDAQVLQTFTSNYRKLVVADLYKKIGKETIDAFSNKQLLDLKSNDVATLHQLEKTAKDHLIIPLKINSGLIIQKYNNFIEMKKEAFDYLNNNELHNAMRIKQQISKLYDDFKKLYTEKMALIEAVRSFFPEHQIKKEIDELNKKNNDYSETQIAIEDMTKAIISTLELKIEEKLTILRQKLEEIDPFNTSRTKASKTINDIRLSIQSVYNQLSTIGQELNTDPNLKHLIQPNSTIGELLTTIDRSIQAKMFLCELREKKFIPENSLTFNLDLQNLENPLLILEPKNNDLKNKLLIQAFNKTFGLVHTSSANASSSFAGGAAGAPTSAPASAAAAASAATPAPVSVTIPILSMPEISGTNLAKFTAEYNSLVTQAFATTHGKAIQALKDAKLDLSILSPISRIDIETLYQYETDAIRKLKNIANNYLDSIFQQIKKMFDTQRDLQKEVVKLYKENKFSEATAIENEIQQIRETMENATRAREDFLSSINSLIPGPHHRITTQDKKLYHSARQEIAAEKDSSFKSLNEKLNELKIKVNNLDSLTMPDAKLPNITKKLTEAKKDLNNLREHLRSQKVLDPQLQTLITHSDQINTLIDTQYTLLQLRQKYFPENSVTAVIDPTQDSVTFSPVNGNKKGTLLLQALQPALPSSDVTYGSASAGASTVGGAASASSTLLSSPAASSPSAVATSPSNQTLQIKKFTTNISSILVAIGAPVPASSTATNTGIAADGAVTAAAAVAVAAAAAAAARDSTTASAVSASTAATVLAASSTQGASGIPSASGTPFQTYLTLVMNDLKTKYHAVFEPLKDATTIDFVQKINEYTDRKKHIFDDTQTIDKLVEKIEKQIHDAIRNYLTKQFKTLNDLVKQKDKLQNQAVSLLEDGKLLEANKTYEKLEGIIASLKAEDTNTFKFNKAVQSAYTSDINTLYTTEFAKYQKKIKKCELEPGHIINVALGHHQNEAFRNLLANAQKLNVNINPDAVDSASVTPVASPTSTASAAAATPAPAAATSTSAAAAATPAAAAATPAPAAAAAASTSAAATVDSPSSASPAADDSSDIKTNFATVDKFSELCIKKNRIEGNIPLLQKIEDPYTEDSYESIVFLANLEAQIDKATKALREIEQQKNDIIDKLVKEIKDSQKSVNNALWARHHGKLSETPFNQQCHMLIRKLEELFELRSHCDHKQLKKIYDTIGEVQIPKNDDYTSLNAVKTRKHEILTTLLPYAIEKRSNALLLTDSRAGTRSTLEIEVKNADRLTIENNIRNANSDYQLKISLKHPNTTLLVHKKNFGVIHMEFPKADTTASGPASRSSDAAAPVSGAAAAASMAATRKRETASETPASTKVTGKVRLSTYTSSNPTAEEKERIVATLRAFAVLHPDSNKKPKINVPNHPALRATWNSAFEQLKGEGYFENINGIQFDPPASAPVTDVRSATHTAGATASAPAGPASASSMLDSPVIEARSRSSSISDKTSLGGAAAAAKDAARDAADQPPTPKP